MRTDITIRAEDRRCPGANPARPRIGARVVAVIMTVAALPLPAGAQGNNGGRWWWDAETRLSQTVRESGQTSTSKNRFDQKELLLNLGVNGFIIHPAIARFRLETDLRFSRHRDGRDIDTNDYGFGAELQGLPRGRFPFKLHYRRQLLGYDTLPGSRLPSIAVDNTTSYGGDMSILKGKAGQLHFGFEQFSTIFQDTAFNTESRGQQVVKWQTGGRAWHQTVLVERTANRYARSSLETDDLIGRYDLKADLGENWDGIFGLDYGQLSTTSNVIGQRDQDSTRSFTRLTRRFGLNRLNMNLSTFQLQDADGQEARTASALFTYTWNHGPRLNMAPSFQYGWIEQDGRILKSPRVGVLANWTLPAQRVDANLRGRVDYIVTRLEEPGRITIDERTGLGLDLSLQHGSPSRLHKSMNLGWIRNDFNAGITRTAAAGNLPGRDLPAAGLGLQDRYSVKLSANRSWSRRRARLFTQYDVSSSDGEASTSGLDSDFLVGGGELALGRFNATAAVGRQQFDVEGTSRAQQTRYRSLATNYSFARYGSLEAIYRTDLQELPFAEDVRGEWLEFGGTFRLTILEFRIRVYERDQTIQGRTTTTRGMTWSLSSRFAGWLPVVTGTKRRGVIR